MIIIYSDYDMNTLGLLMTTVVENKMYFPGVAVGKSICVVSIKNLTYNQIGEFIYVKYLASYFFGCFSSQQS